MWEVARLDFWDNSYRRRELDELLADGWEPFAVTAINSKLWTYHLRRWVLCGRCDGEGFVVYDGTPDEIDPCPECGVLND